MSLFSLAPILLPCPGNCAILRHAHASAIGSARRSHRTGARTESGCPQCGGFALARVTCLAPLTLQSRGGIPKRGRWQPWEEYSQLREVLLQERVMGADLRRRFRFSPGWHAGGRR